MPTNLPEPTLLELEAAEKLYNELRTVDLTKLRFEPGDPVGMYWNEIKKVKPLTPEEEPEVLARYIGGDPEDERDLLERNLWLAFLIALKHQDSGRPQLDLIQEANLGLIKAVGIFDPASGHKFHIFATRKINQEIWQNPSEKITLREHLKQSRSLEEVEKELGVPRERVRCIEQKLARKLRHPDRSKKLKDYLEPTQEELEAEKLFFEVQKTNLDNLDIKPNEPIFAYLKEITRVHPLSPAEENELLLKKIHGDEEAKQRLIEASLLLVCKVAFKYKDSGRTILDLIYEGNLGLIRAVEEYDPAKGYSFSAFATQQINQSIVLFLQKPEAVTKVETIDEMTDASNTEMTLQEAVRSVLKDLPEREREILKLRFNLDEDGNAISEIEQ